MSILKRAIKFRAFSLDGSIGILGFVREKHFMFFNINNLIASR